MTRISNGPFDAVAARLAQLRFKTLFLIVVILLAVDLVIPDPVPLIDEILLGLLTLLFWSWRKPRGQVVSIEIDD